MESDKHCVTDYGETVRFSWCPYYFSTCGNRKSQTQTLDVQVYTDIHTLNSRGFNQAPASALHLIRNTESCYVLKFTVVNISNSQNKQL